MKTNFKKLIKTRHMLEWFSDKPFEEITSTIETMYIKQSASTKMLSFEITSEPQWLTGAKKTEEDDDKVILVRSGVAVTCDFTLMDNNGTYDLNAVFSWVGVNLDAKPLTNMWMDLNGTLDEFGKEGLLKERIYELGSN